ncbi:MAG: hypothetical protein RR194_01465 [Ruthenibacterium sp.]
MNETERTAFYTKYNNSVHRLGRIGTVAAIVLLMGAPLAFGAVLGAGPDWGAFAQGFFQVAIIYWTSSIVEFLVYSPMLGSGASYLAFITGNLINLKIPCAANAHEICHTTMGTPENDVVSTLSVATSSLVNILVLAVGVLCLTPLTPLLQNEALQPAFNTVIPALFGALAFQYFSKGIKIAVVPLLLMCVLFVCVPSLIGSVSFLILLSGALAIGIAALLYKKGKL